MSFSQVPQDWEGKSGKMPSIHMKFGDGKLEISLSDIERFLVFPQMALAI